MAPQYEGHLHHICHDFEFDLYSGGIQCVYAKYAKNAYARNVLIAIFEILLCHTLILSNNQDVAHTHNADSRSCFDILSRTHSPALDSIWLSDQLGVNLL